MDCKRYLIETCNDWNTFLSTEHGSQQSNLPHPTSPSPSRVSHPLPGYTTTKGEGAIVVTLHSRSLVDFFPKMWLLIRATSGAKLELH